MKYEVLIVGRGGQGILLLGRVLGLAAIKYAGLYSVVTESYAAETRGGESRSDVIIASSMEEIPYVKVLRPDILVMMFPYRIDYYKSMINRNTLVIVDEEYVDPTAFKDFRLVKERFGELAEKHLGTRRVANMIVLGRIIREIPEIRMDHVKKAIEEMISPSWIHVNQKAVEIGYQSHSTSENQ